MKSVILSQSRRETLAKLSAVESKLTAKGISFPRRKMLIGRNAIQERLESLEGQLASASASAPAAVTPPKTAAVAAEPVKAKPAAAADTLESLIQQHILLEAKIESLQPKAHTPAKITTAPKASATPAKAAPVVSPANKAKTGAPDIMAIGIGVYGERTIQSWAQTHGADQVEDRICRNLHLSNLGGLIENFPTAHYTKILGEPKPIFGSTRITYADQSAKLQTVLKSA